MSDKPVRFKGLATDIELVADALYATDPERSRELSAIAAKVAKVELSLGVATPSATLTPRHWVFAAAEACRPFVENLDDEGAHCYGWRSHLEGMLNQIADGGFSPTKACRWLGWIQACCYMEGWMSLEQAKEINKAASMANEPERGDIK